MTIPDKMWDSNHDMKENAILVVSFLWIIWIFTTITKGRFEILLYFGQSRPCQSKLEDSTAQLKEKGNVDNFLILLQNQRILTASLALIHASSRFHNLMGKEMRGIFWWLMVCFSSFPWVCKIDVVYISGKCNKMLKTVFSKHGTGGKNAVCKLEIHSGCVHLQSIQHTLSILNLGFKCWTHVPTKAGWCICRSM